jgi:diguanylate cyclase (GGDEF)-like protein
MNTLATGKPDIFKCYAKIMCFALPISYMDEKAVILGQGSFSSYEDFRAFVDLVQTAGIDTISIRAPLSFTSYQQAGKVCGFVATSVNKLLKNAQETLSLKKKFESLKMIVRMWGDSAEERPEALYRNMITKLSSLLDIDCIAILVFDSKQRIYSSLYSLQRGGGTPEVLNIKEDDVVIQDLFAGKTYVLSAEPITDPSADFLHGMGALYFFPIMVRKKLEAILRIDDRSLKEADRQVVNAFCRQTALSIENFRLQQELYKKFVQFAAISELTKSISPLRDYETLLRAILDVSAKLLKAEQGSLMLIDQKTDALLLEAKKGMIDGVAEKIRINPGEGIAGKVAQSGEAILVENVEEDPRIQQRNRQHYKSRSFISIPLKIDGRVIGVLNLSDKATGEEFNKEDLNVIQSFAAHAAIVMERHIFINKTEELKKLTITDPLTGLLNRRYLHERLRDELARSERHSHNFSLLMLDIDGFKNCNDTLGHPVGDKILKTVADTLLNAVRSIDIVARYGGDEFVVILPETVNSVAVDIAERIRNNMSQKMVHTNGDFPQTHTLTTSIGIASYPEHGETVEQLLANVDKALYYAKNRGKNRVEVFAKYAI